MNQPQGQMVSGWYVPPSWSQNLNSALQMGLGTYMGAKIDEEKKAETARLLRELGQGVEVPEEQKPVVFNRLEGMAEGQTPAAVQPELNKIQQLAGRQQPSTEQSMANPAVMQQAPQPKFRPLTEEEKIGRVMELARYDPAAAQIWSAQDTARQARLTKAEERAADRLWREEQARERFLERKDLAQFSASLAAGNRPERNLTIMGPEGEPITMPQSQVPPGSQLYTPAASKAFKEQKSQADAKMGVNEQIQDLRTQYDVLNKNMAIPSEQNKWGSNLGAKLLSTGVGQWLGQVGGAESATARDVIRMSRPGLMQTIVKASGMSAKQIDSNAELKLMLDQATDPTAGYEANMKALDNLQRRFGLVPQQPANPNVSAPQAPTSSKW
jgi:hypothetical protein